MEPLLVVVSTCIYLLLSIVTVFLGDVKDSRAWGRRFIYFVAFSVIYCGFMLKEKFDSIQKEEELQRQLSMAKKQIIAEQNKTNNAMKHLTLATLDFLHPTAYRDYPNFRLGLMWYWLGSTNEAIYHFRHDLTAHPKNIPSMYNLGILLTLTGKHEEALALFNSIPTTRLSADKKKLVALWTAALANHAFNQRLNVSDSTQWELWRIPWR